MEPDFSLRYQSGVNSAWDLDLAGGLQGQISVYALEISSMTSLSDFAASAQVFGMRRNEFVRLPWWRRVQAKQHAGLF